MEFQTDEILLDQKKRRKKRKPRWWLIILSLILVLALGGGGYVYILYNQYRGLVNNLGAEGGKTANAVDNLNQEPFAVMILGEGTNNLDGEAGADSISLLIVNPREKLARLVGVPRDSYLPRGASCNAATYYDKITNSGGDIACLQDTLEDVFDVKINYYVSINFISFVKIVDTLGGVEMDVPDLREGFEAWSGSYDDGTYLSSSSPLKNGEQWCEHDSMRNPYAVCFNQFGPQTVDGEHALALARSRHYDSDFARSERQMDLIKAIVSKVSSNFNVFSVNSLLAAADGNIKTNIEESQFMDFARLGKSLMADEADPFTIQSLQLDGASDTFAGDLNTASFNKVSIFSIEDIRMKIAQTLTPDDFSMLIPEAFYYDPEISQYASKYQRYHTPAFLESYMDVTDSDYVQKFNHYSPPER